MTHGELSIDLKDTEIKIDEPKTWLQKIARKFTGEKRVAKEVVTQLQYLQKIYEICRDFGYKNVMSLDVNGNNVYSDDAYTADDLDRAMELALKETPQDIYHSQVVLQGIDGNEENQIQINMYSQHGEEELPLTVQVDVEKSVEDTTALLEKFKEKINEKFGIESGEVYVDEESEEDYSEEEPTEEEETPSV